MDTSRLYKNIKLHQTEAPFYNAIHPDIYNLTEQKRLNIEMRTLASKIDSHLPVLDLGSGTGNLSNKLQRYGVRVIASDLSQDMLKYGNEAQNKVICDACTLPFKDNSFGAITSYSVLHHLPDLNKGIKEICRVASQDSLLYIDHEPYQPAWEKSNFRYFLKPKLLVNWFLYLAFHPFKLKALLEYLLYGRRRHISNLRDLEGVEDSTIDIESILGMLKYEDFSCSLIIHKNKIDCLIKARKSNMVNLANEGDKS